MKKHVTAKDNLWSETCTDVNGANKLVLDTEEKWNENCKMSD